VGLAAVSSGFQLPLLLRLSRSNLRDNGARISLWVHQVNYTLDVVTATAIYACLNGGGNHPKAANKQTFNSSVAAGFAETPQNGRVDVTTSINGTPLSADGFSCPSGQTLVLASVSYSGVTLTDTTNRVSITLPDVDRNFFNI
jgi:hypothetical protein